MIFAQDAKVYWASEVLEVSSEKKLSNHIYQLHPLAYKAVQALDDPNIMPGTEGSSHAWVPRKPDEIDFIKVGFDGRIHVRQVAIVEAINPSAISKLYLYDAQGKEYLIHSFVAKPVKLNSRLLNIFIPPTPYEVAALKIVLDGDKVPGYNGIDAIGITESEYPVKVSPHIAEGYEHLDIAKSLGDSINSPFKEIGPLFSPDGKRLYFSRMNHPDNMGGEKDLEDIWYSDLDLNTGEWKKAKNLGKPLNNKGPNFICSITPRGYYYDVLLGNEYLRNNVKAGLSIASRYESGYTKPRPVIIDNYENLSPYASYFLANGEQVLLMSVHRRGGQGDRDLYVSFIQNDSTWSTPLNLGNVINTSEVESSPFLALDNKTLYFSSNGHLGYGEQDIFVSRRLDDTWTNWSEPENLGPSVNSATDDVFFNMAPDQKSAYFSRGDQSNTDIYKSELPVSLLPEPVLIVRGQVLNGVTKEPVPNALIQFRDTKQELIVQQLRSDTLRGRYQVILPTGTNYDIFAYHDRLVSAKDEHINAEYIYKTDTITKNILLYPTADGKPILLDAVLMGKITNGKTGQPIANAEVDFVDNRHNTLIAKVKTGEDGGYSFKLPIGSRYNLNVESEGYVSVENEEINLLRSLENDTVRRDFRLYPIELGTRISLDNIYFDFDKAELRPESRTQMEQVYKFLTDNPKVKVEFDGHTCSIGRADYNQKLSEERALAVYQYLSNRGISNKRISSFGFGETRPIQSNDTESSRAQNRRVEFVIVDK